VWKKYFKESEQNNHMPTKGYQIISRWLAKQSWKAFNY